MPKENDMNEDEDEDAKQNPRKKESRVVQDPQPRPDGTYQIGTFTEGSVVRREMKSKVWA